jgi:hypothetical protein
MEWKTKARSFGTQKQKINCNLGFLFGKKSLFLSAGFD